MNYEALKLMNKVQSQPSKGFLNEHQTDVGNAKVLVQLHKNKIRFCPNYGDWLVWNGIFWEKDNKFRLNEFAKDVAQKLFSNATENFSQDKESALKHALRSEQQQRIKAMVEMARSDESIQVNSDDLDKNKHYLNLQNGLFNLKTGKLHKHNSGDLITRVADVEFNQDNDCPKWKIFLKEVTCGDKDLEDSLQRVMGYCISGLIGEHIMPIFIGDGANGKSTFINTIMKILGTYAKQVPSTILLSSKGERHPTEIASLKGVRFASVSETNSEKAFDEAQVKTLIGGDRLTARYMNQDFFEFDPEHKIILATNFLPEIRGVDHGIWRRILVIPFNAKFSESQIDVNLQDKLLRETSGILNWLIEGYRKYKTDGLKISKAMNEAKSIYRDESDILREFLAECCNLDRSLHMLFSDLYKAYLSWTKENGELSISRKSFGNNLQKRGYANFKGGKNKSYRKGLNLKV